MSRTHHLWDTVEERWSEGMRSGGENSSLVQKAEAGMSTDAAAGRRCSKAVAAHTMCGGDSSSRNGGISDAKTAVESRKI